MYGTSPLSGPGDGIFPPGVTGIRIKNATAATAYVAGTVVQLDMQQTITAANGGVGSFAPGHATAGADTLHTGPSADDSVFNVTILPTATGVKSGILFVCEEAIAAGKSGRATLLSASMQARCDGTGTALTAGCPLVANTSGNLVIAPATGSAKIVGFLQQKTGDAQLTALGLAQVFFDGYGGLAQNAT